MPGISNKGVPFVIFSQKNRKGVPFVFSFLLKLDILQRVHPYELDTLKTKNAKGTPLAIVDFLRLISLKKKGELCSDTYG